MSEISDILSNSLEPLQRQTKASRTDFDQELDRQLALLCQSAWRFRLKTRKVKGCLYYFESPKAEVSLDTVGKENCQIQYCIVSDRSRPERVAFTESGMLWKVPDLEKPDDRILITKAEVVTRR